MDHRSTHHWHGVGKRSRGQEGTPIHLDNCLITITVSFHSSLLFSLLSSAVLFFPAFLSEMTGATHQRGARGKKKSSQVLPAWKEKKTLHKLAEHSRISNTADKKKEELPQYTAEWMNQLNGSIRFVRESRWVRLGRGNSQERNRGTLYLVRRLEKNLLLESGDSLWDRKREMLQKQDSEACDSENPRWDLLGRGRR